MRSKYENVYLCLTLSCSYFFKQYTCMYLPVGDWLDELVDAPVPEIS